MNEKQIIREAMRTTGWTQDTLSAKLGYKTQSAVGNKLNGNSTSMRVDTFVRFLSVMGYEVVVQSIQPDINKNKWVVDFKAEKEE